MGGSSPWTRPSAPGCGDTLKALAGDQWGSSLKTAPGSLWTGSPASRTPPHGDDSMYSQANVRAGNVLRPPIRALPSVIVDTEKVMREADGPVGRAALTAQSMLSYCSGMFILGACWKTRYSMVSEQTCTIDHKMDPSV